MTCADVQAVLPLCAAGDAEAATVAAVTEHAAECGHCAADLAGYQRTAAQVRSGLSQWVLAGNMPAELACRLESSIHDEARTQALRVARVRTLLTATAAVAAALVLFMVIPSSSAPGSQPIAGFLAGLFQPTRPAVDPAATAPQVVPVDRSSTMAGLKLTVDSIAYDDQATVVRYRLQGLPARLEAPLQGSNVLAGELLAAAGAVALRGIQFAMNKGNAEAEVIATYAPVPRGTAPDLRISQLPLGSNGEQVRGPWQVKLPARP